MEKTNKIFYLKIVIVFLIILFVIIVCKPIYIYDKELGEILGIENVKVHSKKLVDSGAIGEWYICETYMLDEESINCFLKGEKTNNYFPPDDESWSKFNWEKLPFERKRFEMLSSMVFNYRSGSAIEKVTKEMKEIIGTDNGYYSFLCRPSDQEPRYVIFFLLDINKRKLYVIDLKL